MADIIAEEIQNQEVADDQLVALIRDRTRDIRNDIFQESVMSSECIDTLKIQLEQQIPKLFDAIKESIYQREETE